SLGGLVGLDEYMRLGASLEAGFRISQSSLFVHAMVSGGDGGQLFSGGSYVLARAGLEGRHCFATSVPLCAFLGIDIGRAWDHVEHDFLSDMSPTDEVGNLVVPRAGLELGRAIRARLAVEAPVYLPVGDPDQSVQAGGAMQLGVGYAF
ncbi:MAG: hypothetical protein JNL83_28675, partial [Myxococcales bacterium]|nr:hypothetical protein [Myxococcales bacterium]